MNFKSKNSIQIGIIFMFKNNIKFDKKNNKTLAKKWIIEYNLLVRKRGRKIEISKETQKYCVKINRCFNSNI